MLKTAAVALVLVLAASGCGDEDGGVCGRACKALEDCGLCVFDSTGGCMSVSECRDGCESDPQSKAAAECVDQVDGCDQTAIQNCMNGGGAPGGDGAGAGEDGATNGNDGGLGSAS